MKLSEGELRSSLEKTHVEWDLGEKWVKALARVGRMGLNENAFALTKSDGLDSPVIL